MALEQPLSSAPLLRAAASFLRGFAGPRLEGVCVSGKGLWSFICGL